MEVSLRQHDDNIYRLESSTRLSDISIGQKAKVVKKLKENCVKCPFNGVKCTGMFYIDRNLVLVANNNGNVTVKNCPAEGVPVEV